MGVGKVCAGILGLIPLKGQLDLDGQEKGRGASHTTGSGAFDVILERDASGYATANVPQSIVNHSPSGFEWGYGGSGPADLALNILAQAIGSEAAQKGQLYQKFKWDFIAHMPKEGGVIRKEDIQEWLDKNAK